MLDLDCFICSPDIVYYTWYVWFCSSRKFLKQHGFCVQNVLHRLLSELGVWKSSSKVIFLTDRIPTETNFTGLFLHSYEADCKDDLIRTEGPDHRLFRSFSLSFCFIIDDALFLYIPIFYNYKHRIYSKEIIL